MCISRKELDDKIEQIKEYKSIKKDADKNLKPLEADVKEYLDENGQVENNSYLSLIHISEHTRPY